MVFVAGEAHQEADGHRGKSSQKCMNADMELQGHSPSLRLAHSGENENHIDGLGVAQ